MLVVFGSLKGSPGATSLAAGVASAWTDIATDAKSGAGLVLLVEADPCGGVLATRAGQLVRSGLAGLAAQARGAELSADVVERHVQVLPSGVAALLGPVGADQARSVVGLLAEPLARFARSLPAQVALLADVGRMDPSGPAWPLVVGADGVVLVVRADAEGLGAVAAWLPSRRVLEGRVALVLRAPESGTEFSGREVAAELAIPVLARLPSERAAAGRAVMGPSRRDLVRSGWWSAVDEVTEQARQLRALAPTAPVISPAPVGVRGRS